MSIIKLTVTQREDVVFSTPTEFGFDVSDIVSPIRRDDTDTFSYFYARQKKGLTPDSRFVGKTFYKVSESLANIQALSADLINVTVLFRRDVDMSSENHVLVSSRISENLTIEDAGTAFYYIEDGDPQGVKYVVEESIDEIIEQQETSEGPIIQDEGIDLPVRPKINFVGTPVTVTDGPGNVTTVTITGATSPQEVDIDMTTEFAAGVLTIPPAYQEYDVFNLIGSSGNSISKIIGLSTALRKIQRFKTQAGLNQIFVHTSVGSVVANNLISDAAAANTIFGDNDDIIEYESAIANGVSVCRRYNAVISA